MNFDDLLKAWSEAKDQFIIDEAPSLFRKDLTDGAINVEPTYSSIAFYGGQGFFNLWRCAYVDPFACNFSRVLEEDKRTKLNEIANKFFVDGGILVVPIVPASRRNIDFVCKLFGESFYCLNPYDSISRIPFPLMRVDVACKGKTHLNVNYPAGTILWGCYWPFDIKPVDTECIELKESFDASITPEKRKLEIYDFMDLKKHRFPGYSPSTPYMSLDDASYLGNALPAIIAVKVYDGAVIAVPESAKDSLMKSINSFKHSNPNLNGFQMIFEWRTTKKEVKKFVSPTPQVNTTDESPAVIIKLGEIIGRRVKIKIKTTNHEHSVEISIERILMFLIIYSCSSQTDRGVGYLSTAYRQSNSNSSKFPELIDNEENAISPKIYPISNQTEYSYHLKTLVHEILTGKVRACKDNKELEKKVKSVWAVTSNKNKLISTEKPIYSWAKLSCLKIEGITIEFLNKLKESLPDDLKSATECEFKKLEKITGGKA